MMDSYEKDALAFARALKNATLHDDSLCFGEVSLRGEKGVNSSIQYNKVGGIDLLEGNQEYTFYVSSGKIELSLQLYLNDSNHFRLFCFTKCNKDRGMAFSVNLTTKKENLDTIFLTQKIKFSERINNNIEISKEERKEKQDKMCEMLKILNFNVSDNNDVALGVFNPQTGSLINATMDEFLSNFILISLIKGHFQGNKGYDLDAEIEKMKL